MPHLPCTALGSTPAWTIHVPHDVLSERHVAFLGARLNFRAAGRRWRRMLPSRIGAPVRNGWMCRMPASQGMGVIVGGNWSVTKTEGSAWIQQ